MSGEVIEVVPAVVAPAAGEEQSPPAVQRVKTCAHCQQVLPMSAFYRTHKNHRTGHTYKVTRSSFKICKACRSKQVKDKRKADKKDRHEALLGMLSRAATKKTIDVAHISEVASILTGKLNGVEEACQMWADQIKALVAAGEAQKAVRALEGWGNLILKSTENRQTAPDVTGLTNSDIDREILDLLSLESGGKRLCGEN